MLSPGDRLDRYVVEGTVGTGAIGRVLRARHAVLGTLHALKVLRVDDPEARARLIREGRTQARLDHPGLVRVTDVLTLDDGRPVLVMDLVEGPTLAHLLARVRPSPDEARRLLHGIVEAVAWAHAHGVVHRDLKPANVLLDTSVRPTRPRVTDFGIARALDVPGQTLPGRMLGTVGYLAPEQLGDAAAVGPAADVFSLGVLLVELCTGRAPFATGDVGGWLEAVRSRAWTPPEDLPAHLADLARDCLAPDPAARPADAGVVLQRLGGTSVQPAPGPPPRQARATWMLPVGVGLVALAAGLLVGGLIGPGARQAPASPTAAAWSARAWQVAQDRPDEALALLRAASSLRRAPLPDDRVQELVRRGAAVQVLPADGPVVSVALTADAVFGLTRDGRLLGWDRATGETRVDLSTRVEQGRDLIVQPDGRGALVRPHPALGRARSDVVVWGLPDGAPHIRLPGVRAADRHLVDDTVLAIADGLGDAPGRIVAWDLDGRERWSRPVDTRHLAPSRVVGGRLWVGWMDGRIEVLDLADGRLLDAFDRGQEAAVFPRPGTDGALVVDRQVAAWVPRDGRGVRPLAGFHAPAEAVWSPAGERMLVHHARWRHVELGGIDGRPPVALRGHTRPVIPPIFLDGGARVATASHDGTVRLWTGDAGTPLTRLLGHQGLITQVVGDAASLVTGSLDRTARVWALPERLLGVRRFAEARPLADGTRAFAQDHGRIAYAPLGGSLVGWRPGSGRPARTGTAVEDLVAVAVAAEAEVVAGKSGRRATWILGPDGLSASWPTLPGQAWMALSGDGRRLAVANRVRFGVWTLDPPTQVAGGPITGSDPRLAWADEADLLVVGHGAEGTVDLWTGAPPMQVGTLTHDLPDQRGIARLDVTPDGAWVAAGLWGGGAVAWTGDGTRTVELGVLGDDVVLIGLAPGGDRVVTGTRAGRVEVWSLPTGRSLGTLTLGVRPTEAVFDGDRVWVGDVRGRVAAWTPGAGPPRLWPAHGGPVAALWREADLLWTLGEDGLARGWEPQVLLRPVGDLQTTGRLTNLRVCRDTAEVVPVVPFPDPHTVWAPDEACR